MSGKGEDGDETLRAAITKRVEKEERAFRMVEKMVLNDTVDRKFFLNAGKCITVSQYKDVVEERGISKQCGYPLCDNKLVKVLRQKYKISLKEHKVYDITERKNFCSKTCYKASKYYECQLLAEPVWMRDSDKPSVDVKLFDESQVPKHSDDNVAADDVKNRGSSNLVQNTSANPMSVCQKPTELDIDNTATGFPSETFQVTERHAVDNPTLDCKERKNLCTSDHQRQGDSRDEKQQKKLIETVDSRRNEGDEAFQRLSEMRLESTVASEKDSNVILSSGNSCVSSRCSEESSGDSEEITKRKRFVEVVHQTLREWCSAETRSYCGRRCRVEEGDTDEKRDFTFSRADHTSRDVALRDSDDDDDDVIEETMKQEIVTSGTRDKLGKKGGTIVGETTRKDFTFSRANRTSRDVALRDSDDDDDDVIEETMKQEIVSSGKRDKLGKKGGTIVGETTRKELTVHIIDSKSPMSIRGKIVSEKITKALSPMLSRLGLAFADVSCDLTNILKTLRFTNTNIVLKPFQWTLIGLTLFITLTRCNTTLRTLLGSRQKHFHSLLNDVAISEDDLNRLVDVLIPWEHPSPYEPAIASDIDRRKFNMEELD